MIKPTDCLWARNGNAPCQNAPESAPQEQAPDKECEYCGGTGEADSGGMHPWGSQASIRCRCTYPKNRANDRAEFERAMAAEGYESNPSIYRDGTYREQHYSAAWAMWQRARKTLSEPQEQFQQVGWAISYDGGKTPYCLWYEGDGDLLDLEVRRLGGTASKMPLFAKVPE